MAWGRKNTRKNTGKPDAIGFKGKFLIDAHKRDTEYLANIEALHTFKHRYDRVVSPVEGLPREDVVREVRRSASSCRRPGPSKRRASPRAARGREGQHDRRPLVLVVVLKHSR